MDETSRLLESIAIILSTLIWPAIFLFVLWRFGPELRDFLRSLGEFTLKVPGIEATAKRQQVEATAALVAATANRAAEEQAPSTANVAKEAVKLVQEEVTPWLLRKASRSLILWVDDHPENNIYERQSLEALGLEFILARTTEDAIERSQPGKFVAIISDMGRSSDPRAGYTLLEKLRASGDQTPYIIYTGSSSAGRRAEARKRGALGSTNRPQELFEYVLQALRTAV